jgi:hypothetical protein
VYEIAEVLVKTEG